jgi:hypothetical protein
MKVLLDENLPHDLRKSLVGHDVYTAAYMGWSSIRNGLLLSHARAADFEAMVNGDSGIYYQQNLSRLPIAVVIVRSKTNQIEDVLPLVPLILSALSTIQPRAIAVVP